VLASLEDTWSWLGVYYKDVIGSGAPPKTPDMNEALEYRVRVTYSGRYGQFELFDQNYFCVFVGTGIQTCEVDIAAMRGITKPASEQDTPTRIAFEKNIDTGMFTLVFEGTYRATYYAMQNVFYRANTHQNTNRLKNRIYSPGPSRDFPYEEVVISLETADVEEIGGETIVRPYAMYTNHSHLMHIVDINDVPTIEHPQDVYEVPIQCLAKGTLYPECHFGQFFSYEDTDPRVQIGGVVVADIDAYELCTYLQQECKKIDVSVRAFKGAIALNTRSRLSFYETTRGGQGFTAFVTASNAAIKVLFYQVEVTELLGPTGGSSVLHYNTQHSGQREYVTVRVSDQGFTGAAGIARVNSIEIPLEIVAVNDAPQLQTEVLEYSKLEDIPSILEGLAVSDVDVEEQIDSSLSRATWMRGPTRQSTLNKLRLTFEVTHGKLRLGYMRNLNLIQTQDVAFMTLSSVRFGHDTCRIRELLDQAAKISQYGPSGVVYPAYSKACGLSNLGQVTCLTGNEATCSCRIDDLCFDDGTITLYIDNARAAATVPGGGGVSGYIETLSDMIADQDKTCGGMATFATPNNFTQGLKCNTDDDCIEDILPACTLGVNCTCCANATFVCSSHADCSGFDAGSLCGCMLGGPGDGECGPWYTDPEMTQGETTDLVEVGVLRPRLYGSTCTYRAPYPNALLPGATDPEIRQCLGGAMGVKGSGRQKVLDLISLTGAGTKLLTIEAGKVDIDRTLLATQYVTDLNYNRRYRPPVSERDPTTFNIEQDNVDSVTIEAQDLGNAGGSQLDNKIVSMQVPIRVIAINNKPVANGPATVLVTEDTPYHFMQDARDAEGQPIAPITGLFVSDPDYKDYGFSIMSFEVNLTCFHGRLFLNETFLQSKGVSAVRVQYKTWSNDQETRGLHYSKNTIAEPRFGDGCQFSLQCTDNDEVKSLDTPFGFYETLLYGVVYSPLAPGEPPQGCGLCPEDTGNKFLSITGTFDDVNAALSLVTYLPDPNFNTRTGSEEYIIFEVNDLGAIGNDQTAPHLRDVRRIPVTVESVNDRPILGRRVMSPRIKRTYDDGGTLDRTVNDVEIKPLDSSRDSLCQGIPPAGEEYFEKCGPLIRTHIDIDEDTPFIVTPDVLWIHDVDSEEAEEMNPESRRHCCAPAGENGCTCGKPCLCQGAVCACDIPLVCQSMTDNGVDSTVPIPGQLLVHMEVGADKGLLSFFPPPGRILFPETEFTFLTNSTETPVQRGGPFKPCAVQRECMQNVSSITFRTTKGNLQTALQQMFLTYSGQQDFYGQDRLAVWVTDQGFTDECYATKLETTGFVSIRVIAVNDAPVITFPNEVLLYQKGRQCYADFGQFANIEGLSRLCEDSQNASMIPPNKPGSAVELSDVDIAATEYGNVTLMLKLGSDAAKHLAAGRFFLNKINIGSRNWYEEFNDVNGFVTLALMGKIDDMNKLLEQVRYDADPTYQGYVPLYVTVNDMLNFGECSGSHQCGQSAPCADHRNAEAHQEPQPMIADALLDVTIGAKTLCSATSCKDCNAEEGCGWCPGLCSNPDGTGGKCMIGDTDKPRFENCPVSARDGFTYRQCEGGASNIVAIGAGVGGAVFLLMICVGVFLTWVSRRHGEVLVYAKKKRADFIRAGHKMHILPPPEANYNQFFFLLAVVACVVGTLLLTSGSSTPSCEFTETYFLDKASSIHMELDSCTVRFLPTRLKPAPDNALQAIKVKIAYENAPGVTLQAETCGVDASFSITNSRDDAVRYLGYYCNIEVLVPDRFVMPQTTIVALGENVTTVRAGPMDKDAPDFGLDFGPNSFELEGNFLNARLENISAKVFNFNVLHGGLIAVDLLAPTADFRSMDADMIVTSKTETHVDFWQKTKSFGIDTPLVCLTAAEGSLYVNDACREICEYKDQTRRFMDATSTKSSLMDADPIPRNAGLAAAAQAAVAQRESNSSARAGAATDRRVNPWLCEIGDPLLDNTWNCSLYDPVEAEAKDRCVVGAPYLKKSDVPQIDGCTDLENCILDESPQCLCKPTCDMADLDPPGTCNDFGQCCQTICAGYSRADMFPRANMPRCGTTIDPVLYWWCNGQGMRQQWRFTSDAGQISLHVRDPSLDDPMNDRAVPMVSSYKGAAPVAEVTAALDILYPDQITLDEQFHPGGANAPLQQWFSLRLRGPGAPEASIGEFIVVESIRYLVIMPWMFSVFSQGLLAPKKGAVTLRLNPAFCPSYLDPESQAFQDRLVQARPAPPHPTRAPLQIRAGASPSGPRRARRMCCGPHTRARFLRRCARCSLRRSRTRRPQTT